MSSRLEGRERRKLRIRKRVNGSATRPRLAVFRTAKHIYAQLIDDVTGKTLATVSTLSTDVRTAAKETEKTGQAKLVGAAVAKVLKSKGIDSIVFDRSGYLYHGRIKALAEAAREAGLKF